jgi:hypothetical protein
MVTDSDGSGSGRDQGRTTFERYGSAHMAEIGKQGFETTIARHWQDDLAAYRDSLGLRRHEQQLESFVVRELARPLANREKLAWRCPS